MPGRRYNCRCGKKRYRDESLALAAADADARQFGEPVTVYRCPGGLAWHLTSHGFTPEALRSLGRRLAYELLRYGAADPDELRQRLRLDPRRTRRLEQCVTRMTALGLATRTPYGRLIAVDPAGLKRVVQIGLDAWTGETAPH
jgi:hypothetical protein